MNLCLLFLYGYKLHKTIFSIIYLGSHKFLQTEHPHRSFHLLFFVSYCTRFWKLRLLSPSIFKHKVSSSHFPQVFFSSSTRIKHDNMTLYCRPCAVFLSSIWLLYSFEVSSSLMISLCTTDLFPDRLIFVSTALNISSDNLNSGSLLISYFSDDWKKRCNPNYMLTLDDRLYSSPFCFLTSA